MMISTIYTITRDGYVLCYQMLMNVKGLEISIENEVYVNN